MASTADLISLVRELGAALEGEPDENVPNKLPRLAGILASETDPRVVAATVTALGQAWDPQAAQLILDHVRTDHPHTEVRLAVAQCLPNGVEDDTPCRDAVIEALITLTNDESSDVRDWACFGLGQVDAASPEVRDALAARLTDPDDDTRCEALLALAKTGDSRAGAVLQQRLIFDPDDVLFRLELLAAAELAEPNLHPLLLRLSEEWAGDDNEFMPALAFATSRCHPGTKAQATNVERELVARVNTLLAAQGLTAATVGDYPRTALTFNRVEDSTPLIVFDAIWRDEDPGTTPSNRRPKVTCSATRPRPMMTKPVRPARLRETERQARVRRDVVWADIRKCRWSRVRSCRNPLV
jgi:HEAT repeat protein